MKITVNLSFENKDDLETYLKENNVSEKDIIDITRELLLKELDNFSDDLTINNIYLVKNKPNNKSKKKKKK